MGLNRDDGWRNRDRDWHDCNAILNKRDSYNSDTCNHMNAKSLKSKELTWRTFIRKT